MNWREFFSSIIGSLAWPAVVLVIVLLLVVFRKRVLEALKELGPLQSLKAGPGGVELSWFDRTLRDAQSSLEDEPPVANLSYASHAVPPESFELGESFISDMTRLALVSPRSVVQESAARLEDYLRALLTSNEILDVRQARTGLGRLVEAAFKAELVTENERRALRDVTTLRNTVAHESGFEIDISRALAFADLVQQTARAVWLRQTD